MLHHQVTCANCVSAALQAASRATFDLVISDVQLPDGNGMDLMKELSARRPIKGIAVTGHGVQGDDQWAKASGFHKYLTKPR